MRIVVMAGGTGGHVFPALAVADELRARGHDVTWIGAPDSFEQRTVVPHGFEIDTIPVRGLRGKGLRALLSAPLLLWHSVREARGILLRRRPHVVLGMGGFVTGPGGVSAWLTRTPPGARMATLMTERVRDRERKPGSSRSGRRRAAS